ncbi:MAG: RNA-binding S4 domain-containing protein [Gammaproteobacteria bacterium]|nr:RNA-binding S4 domain-containing protein [Gammaproteobacteria bacterium]
MTTIDATDAAVRLDRWLHATRWFKTRSIAVDAINNGRVEINGERAKPAKLVRTGDVLRIRRPPLVHEVVVTGLIERRVAAPLAQAQYAETAASIAARSRLEEQLALARVVEERRGGKLDRKDRRARERLKRSPDWAGNDGNPPT